MSRARSLARPRARSRRRVKCRSVRPKTCPILERTGTRSRRPTLARSQAVLPRVPVLRPFAARAPAICLLHGDVAVQRSKPSWVDQAPVTRPLTKWLERRRLERPGIRALVFLCSISRPERRDRALRPGFRVTTLSRRRSAAVNLARGQRRPSKEGTLSRRELGGHLRRNEERELYRGALVLARRQGAPAAGSATRSGRSRGCVQQAGGGAGTPLVG